MKSKSNRRKFIRDLGIGGVISASTQSMLQMAHSKPGTSVLPELSVFPKDTGRDYNGPYSGPHLNRVAFPIGGIGTGMFCLEGTGAISHMSVLHRPAIFHEPGVFGAITIRGKQNIARILEGPVPDWKKYGLPLAGNGLGGSISGLPHFQEAIFTPRFPFASISLKDEVIPMEVKINGWSPFIPTEADRSSLPVGALEYTFTNLGTELLEAVFSFNAKNFLKTEGGNSLIRSYPNGFILSEQGTEEKPYLKADFAIFTNSSETAVDHCWFRGGWWDPLTMAWNNIKSGSMQPVDPVESGAPGASLFVPLKLDAGQTSSLIVYMTWYVPQSDLKHGKTVDSEMNCDPAAGCCNTSAEGGFHNSESAGNPVYYKPWYSSRFSNIEAVCGFWKEQYATLRQESDLFSEAFYASSLPPVVMEAIACNLSILKSTTVMRQHDGRFWCYEGSGDNWGCCHGSCTHVWNYAQAVAHLFPELERSLRQTEFCENQDREGHQTFRATLPIGPNDHAFHAAADGQLGGIMKVYREWRISGSRQWLEKIFPMVRVSMDYCIRTWDPDEKGVIEEPHHNTYDIEFWGPDGMHSSFYLGALSALIAMGRYLGEEVSRYERVLEKGREFAASELFDGEYFIQKIQYTGLRAKDPVAASFGSINAGTYSDEAKALLEREGPKYQYGTGCLSDGVLGAWITRMCGIDDVLDSEMLKSHLISIHRYNLKNDLSNHANPQRPSFALGNEGGLLLCSWPKGGKLSLPFVYSDEVWTGIEHQVAAHLMLVGKVQEGLDIVRTSRNRYDGRVRNPFNEYECGSWYARALASYGYFQCLTGVRFDAVDKTLYVQSQIGDFTSFLSTNTGFGTVTLKDGQVTVWEAHGHIPVEHIVVSSV